MGGIAVGSRIMFAGGLSTGGKLLQVVQIYEPSSRLWSVIPIAGHPRNGIGTAKDDRYVFFVGGASIPIGEDIVNIFDSWTGQWSSTRLPRPRGGASACVVNGRLYIVGGNNGIQNIMDVYVISSGKWSKSTLPNNVIGTPMLALGSYLVLPSVGNNATNPPTDIYNTLTGRWRVYAGRSTARGRPAVLLNGGKIMIAGGSLITGSATDIVDILDLGPQGTTYCTPATPNSTGQPATLSAFGTPSARDDFVTFTATNVPAQTIGMLLVGDAQGFSPFAGGSQGTLCLGGHMARFTANITGNSELGDLVFDPILSAMPLTPMTGVQPGETWHFQVWYRDRNPGPTSNFTDAVSISFQ